MGSHGAEQLQAVLATVAHSPLCATDRKGAVRRAIELAMLGPAALDPAPRGKADGNDALSAVQGVVDFVAAKVGCSATVGQAVRALRQRGDAGRSVAARLQQGSRARNLHAHPLDGLLPAVGELLAAKVPDDVHEPEAESGMVEMEKVSELTAKAMQQVSELTAKSQELQLQVDEVQAKLQQQQRLHDDEMQALQGQHQQQLQDRQQETVRVADDLKAMADLRQRAVYRMEELEVQRQGDQEAIATLEHIVDLRKQMDAKREKELAEANRGKRRHHR